MIAGKETTSGSVGSVGSDVWVELESDPGLFTLLIEDFGVRDVEVEEIYDLNSSVLENSTVYGFIFLFKWVEGSRRSRRVSIASSTSGTIVTDEATINRMFFAQQIVTNACATHALLSILLNNQVPQINLGASLTRFKQETYGMTPERKGQAIGKSASLAWAHNKHARPDARRQMESEQAASDGGRIVARGRLRSKLSETFHFISYLPIDGRLYELDGLKSCPVDHGAIPEGMTWTRHFQSIISERIELVNSILDSNEIRYNLMALVPSKVEQYRRSLAMLQANRLVLYNSLEKLLEATNPSLIESALRQAKADMNERPGSSSSGIDSQTLIDAARSLSPKDSDQFSAPLSVLTNVDVQISSGVSNQSIFNWPIVSCEVVDVTENKELLQLAQQRTDFIAADNNTTSYNIPANDVSQVDRFLSKSGQDDVSDQRYNMDFELKFALTAADGQEDMPSTSRVESSIRTRAGQPNYVVKLATSGSRRFGLFGPLGLVNYVLRLEDKIAVVERVLNDELARYRQWRIDDERRTHDYDPFIRTFLMKLVRDNVVSEKELPKNGKWKTKRFNGRAAEQKSKKRRV